MKIRLTGLDLTLEDLINVARKHEEVEIAEEALKKVRQSRKIVDEIVSKERVVYGITTGFGSLCNVFITTEQSEQLQENLIRTHSTGYGTPLSEDEVRAIMLIRVNSLLKGVSGVCVETLDILIEMLNKNVVPFIPEKGSLGASGDLAPISHMVLPMLGLGKAYYKGELLSGNEAMKRAGINTIKLKAKEGLALINGTSVLTAIGALAVYDAINLSKEADIMGALSLEAHRGIIDPFYEKLHLVRPHKGALTTAKNICNLTENSTLLTHMAEIRVQDGYSLRCIPQIHGASKDSINYVAEKVEIEINSATDNPVIFSEDEVISGGNFHGELMAQPFDFLTIAVSEIGAVSERRLERLVNHQLSDFPAFLVKHPGLNSGFMITQYAAAALASENKILAHPASVDSIPSCENQEDFVSMGTIAARKAREVVKNSRRILATELLAAVQALDFRKELSPGLTLGKGTQRAYDVVRESIDFIENDKDIEIYNELEKSTKLLSSGTLLKTVGEVVDLKI